MYLPYPPGTVPFTPLLRCMYTWNETFRIELADEGALQTWPLKLETFLRPLSSSYLRSPQQNEKCLDHYPSRFSPFAKCQPSSFHLRPTKGRKDREGDRSKSHTGEGEFWSGACSLHFPSPSRSKSSSSFYPFYQRKSSRFFSFPSWISRHVSQPLAAALCKKRPSLHFFKRRRGYFETAGGGGKGRGRKFLHLSQTTSQHHRTKEEKKRGLRTSRRGGGGVYTPHRSTLGREEGREKRGREGRRYPFLNPSCSYSNHSGSATGGGAGGGGGGGSSSSNSNSCNTGFTLRGGSALLDLALLLRERDEEKKDPDQDEEEGERSRRRRYLSSSSRDNGERYPTPSSAFKTRYREAGGEDVNGRWRGEGEDEDQEGRPEVAEQEGGRERRRRREGEDEEGHLEERRCFQGWIPLHDVQKGIVGKNDGITSNKSMNRRSLLFSFSKRSSLL